MTVDSTFSVPDGSLDQLRGRLPAVLAFIEEDGAVSLSSVCRPLMPTEDNRARTLVEVCLGHADIEFISPVLTAVRRGLEAGAIASFTCGGKEYAAELHLCPWHPAGDQAQGSFLVLSDYWEHKDSTSFGLPWHRASFHLPEQAIIVLGADQKITACNKKAAQILKLPANKVSGKKATKFMSFESGSDGTDGDDLTVKLVKSKEMDEHVECMATAVPMAGENCISVLMWNAEDSELSFHSTVRHAAMAGNMADPMLITKKDGIIVEANKNAGKILNLPRTKLIGQNALLMGSHAATEKNIVRQQKKLAEILARDGILTITDSIENPEMGELFLETVVTPFKDVTSGRDMYLWVARDITRRRQAQQELRRQALIIEQMADAVFILDLEGGILDCNPAAARLCGRSKEKTLDCRLSELLRIDDPQFRDGSKIIKVLQKGKFWAGELAYISAEGEPGFLNMKLVQLIDGETGKEIGIICLAQDITEQKKTEEQLRDREEVLTCRVADLEDARQRLERQSNELTSLADDLHYAREEAEHANRMKSHFLATMSHEIRTPMNGIMGMAQLLKDSKLDSQQSEYATALINSASSLLGLVNDILDISKLEAGAVELEMLEFDIQEVVEGSAEIFAVQAGEKAVDMVLYIDPAMPRLLVGDPARLRQMLLNLVGNALKFTDSGAISLEVSEVERAEKSVRLAFHIRDTGTGIRKGSLSRLFKTYSQAEVSTNRTYGGTGLGLAICKELVTAMKGEITVESVYGQGSDFHFSVWLDIAGQQPGEDAGLELLAHKSAVVIDPVQMAGKVLARQLAAWGLEVENFSAVETAFTSLFDEHVELPDYLFVSQKALKGERFGLWQKMLKRTAGEKTRTILLKPFTDQGDATEIGADLSLRRPVKPSFLFAKLLQCVSAGVVADQEPALEKYPRTSGKKSDQTGDQGQGAFEPLNILVAEDNDVSQLLIQVMLQKAGHNSTLVENGQDAIRQVQAEAYDLVLMDVQMPIMDGVTAIAEIRKLGGAFESLPVIALTANAMSGDRENYLKGDMNGYVPKPIQWSVLEGEIFRLTGRSSLAPAAEPGQTWYDRVSSDEAGKEQDQEKDALLKELLQQLPGG